MAKLYMLCSMLMAVLFIVSASVQLNDPDWYFWIPLYTGAAYVNLMNCLASVQCKRLAGVGNMILLLGELLLSKVILDNYLSNEGGIWSVDMRQRVVRETIGSALVILSMILQVSAAKSFKEPAKKENMEVALATKYGMALLVGISYGLSLVFLVYHAKEMEF